jgi:hypothetical protein
MTYRNTVKPMVAACVVGTILIGIALWAFQDSPSSMLKLDRNEKKHNSREKGIPTNFTL